MSYLSIDELPKLERPTLLAAFAGWPDAGEVATGVLRYVIDKLQAWRFARIDAEEFYVFTQLRPSVRISEGSQRVVVWPSNDIYAWKSPGDAPDLVCLLGAEPHLKWHAYIASIQELVQQVGAVRCISLGGTLDSVPHTREPLVSGTASAPTLREALEALAVRSSSYEGPTSIHSALHEALNRGGIPTGSLWGHAPHYLQATPNPKVCLALLRKLNQLLHLTVALGEFEEAALSLERQVDQVMDKNPELRNYVRQLEEIYQEPEAPMPEPPSPRAIVEELEEFLRRQREQGQGGGGRG